MNAVVMVVIIWKTGDVHQPFYIDLIQRYKQAEACNGRHNAFIGLPNVLLHVFALEPVHGVPGSFISATFSGRAVLSHGLYLGSIVRINRFAIQVPGANPGDMTSLDRRANDMANSPVYQQVRVTANGRSKMGIGIERQAKMALVIRGINRLTHGAQHHQLDNVEIRPFTHLIQ